MGYQGKGEPFIRDILEALGYYVQSTGWPDMIAHRSEDNTTHFVEVKRKVGYVVRQRQEFMLNMLEANGLNVHAVAPPNADERVRRRRTEPDRRTAVRFDPFTFE